MARLTANSKTNHQTKTSPKTNPLSFRTTNQHTNRPQSMHCRSGPQEAVAAEQPRYLRGAAKTFPAGCGNKRGDKSVASTASYAPCRRMTAIAHDLDPPRVTDKHIIVQVGDANIWRDNGSGFAADAGTGMASCLIHVRPSFQNDLA